MKAFLREAERSFAFNEGAKEFTRICKPFLDEFQLENFYYVRITRKGESVYLTNHVEFALDYWEAGLPLRTGFDASPDEVQSFALPWEGIIEQEIIDFTETKKCFNGFSFVERYHNTVQFASFLRSTPIDNPAQHHLKNKNKLRCWLRDFEWKNRHLIRHAEQNPLVLPMDYLEPEKKSFYPERTMKLHYRGIQSKISFRELDCLHLHSKGFTCPRIAEVLSLSPRTVETHLDSVKNRFGLFSRDELAAFAYANPLIESYSPRL